jgi:hypothetical protein
VRINEPFVPKYDRLGVEVGQTIDDDPRLGRLVKTQICPGRTLKITKVYRWSNGIEWFSTHDVTAGAFAPVVFESSSTAFEFID